MGRIRAWWTDARAWLAAASPRERRLITLAGGGILLFVVLVTYASFSAAIRRAETALDEKRSDFEKISRLAAGYGALEQEAAVRAVITDTITDAGTRDLTNRKRRSKLRDEVLKSIKAHTDVKPNDVLFTDVAVQ